MGSAEVTSPQNAPPQMGEDREMNRHLRPSSAELAPALALEDDNLLAEFLLRLPPLPSSLLRASLVCKRWRRLVSEPHFLHRFSSHHQKAPLLGFIYDDFRSGSIGFISTLDSPDRIPAAHFSLQLEEYDIVLDCHHGLVLILNWKKCHAHVWDPVTRDHRYVALFPGFNDTRMYIMDGVVLCTAKDQGHVHGTCHSDHFKIVLVDENGVRFCFSIYSSDTGAWGHIISLPWALQNMRAFSRICNGGILVGNSVCWLLIMERAKILQFDLDEQNLAFIDVPMYVSDIDAYFDNTHQLSIMPVESAGINFIVLEGFTVRVWKRMSSGSGVASWMLGNTFELNNHLSLRPSGDERQVQMLASAEDGNVMFRLTDGGVIVMVHLGTMQFKILTDKMDNHMFRPFVSFYIAGKYYGCTLQAYYKPSYFL